MWTDGLPSVHICFAKHNDCLVSLKFARNGGIAYEQDAEAEKRQLRQVRLSVQSAVYSGLRNLLPVSHHLYRDHGVDIFFEEQNIHTLSADGELMLTILASYAQEESLSASENAKWRIRKGFEAGELMNFRYLFGYIIVKGKVSVHEANAKIVREVFSRFVNGSTLAEIAHWLNESGVPPIESGEWTSKKLRAMLRNEKYTGNALLQKTFSNNHLEKKKKINRGELPMYYVEDC